VAADSEADLQVRQTDQVGRWRPVLSPPMVRATASWFALCSTH